MVRRRLIEWAVICAGLASNVGLTATKGIAGVMMNSASLLAEAGHSFSDLLGVSHVRSLPSHLLNKLPGNKLIDRHSRGFRSIGFRHSSHLEDLEKTSFGRITLGVWVE